MNPKLCEKFKKMVMLEQSLDKSSASPSPLKESGIGDNLDDSLEMAMLEHTIEWNKRA